MGVIRRAIDWIVNEVSPKAGYQRMVFDKAVRAYEGASKKDGWSPRRSGASANTDHLADASQLRVRSRALYQSVGFITRGMNSLVANIIGTGIVPRFLAPNEEAINRVFDEFVKQCDADGKTNLYGLQKKAYKAAQIDGEVLIRIRPRRASDGLAVPVQLQILEIDYLDTNKNQMAPDNSGNYIINGIEYNSLGRVVNYWLFDQHPGDISVTSMMRRTESNAVSAKNVIHFYSADRPGQGRGIPRLAPVIPKIRDVMTLEDAELQRKNLETRLSVLTSGDVSSMALSSSPGLDEVRSTGELGDLASGSIIQLPPGSSMSVVEPKAAPGFVEYMKYQMHLIASGMGIEYHMMVGDASEGNFSSTRALTIEFRRLAEQEQWLEVIPNLCDKMLNVFFDYAVLAGKLPVEVDRRVDWSTPKWDYVNPKDDVKADLDEIAGGLSSFSEKLRRRGYKPDIVFNELEQDIKTLKDKGVLEVMIAMQGKGGMNNQPGAVSGKDKPADKSREMPDTRMFDMVESVVRMAMEGKEGKEQQPNITVSPNLSIDSRDFEKAAIDFFARMEDQMKIVVNVPEQAPIVNFNPEIRVEPSKVEVQQPVVNVEVKPADVAYMHPRSASARHIRDDKGEIVETVTEYKK